MDDKEEPLTMTVCKSVSGPAPDSPVRKKMGMLGKMANFLDGVLGLFGGGSARKRGKGRHKRFSSHRQKQIADEKKARKKKTTKLSYPYDKWSASAFHCPKCEAKPSTPCHGTGPTCNSRPGYVTGSKRSRIAG